MKTITHWVNGAPTSLGSTRVASVYDPATGERQAEVVLAHSGDVDGVVACAAAAFETWSQTSLSARSKVLFKFREIVERRTDELARVTTDEHGKILADAVGEVRRGLEVIEYACSIPSLLKGDYSDQVSTGIDVFSFREALGVVAGITPFNFPVMVPMWMYPVAIACGNTFVLKPSERDPSASLLVAQMWKEAGLPDGVFNVVQGDKEAVEALLDHPSIAAVSFVGSSAVAQHVYSRGVASGKRIQALGGAKNHAVVLPDADLDLAADHLVAAGFGAAGERCMAISAAVAVGPIGDALLDAISAKARAVRVGSGHDPKSDMGPVISAASRDRIISLINSGEEDGARVAVDGRRCEVPGFANGFFVGPTVVDDVTTNMRIYREEVFGPVLCVTRVEGVQDAIAMVNKNPYGNGAAIFTSQGDAAREFQRGVKVGMIGINVPIPTPVAYYSFGGWKNSLFGQSHIYGPDGVAFYTHSKVVTSRWSRAPQISRASYHFTAHS